MHTYTYIHIYIYIYIYNIPYSLYLHIIISNRFVCSLSDNLEAHTTELDFANNNVGGEVASFSARQNNTALRNHAPVPQTKASGNQKIQCNNRHR